MNLGGHRLPVEKLGAYALGHLVDDERAELEAHLEDCPACRAELENILPVAALLPKADPYRLEEPLVGPPPGLDQWVYERVEQERRREARRRPSGIGWFAAAAIVLVVFALATFFLTEERGKQVSLRPVSERTELSAALQDLEATATLNGERYSTQIELEARELTPGQTYAVWIERADGTRASAGGFQAYDEGPITVYLSAALPPDEAVGLGVGTPEGETGLRADLQGGDDGDLIVPDLRGRTLEDAIEAAGPDFEVDARGDDGGRPGETVVDQDPGLGDRARKGTTVSVTLGSDRQASEDPDRTNSGSSETESPEAESVSYGPDSGLDAETATDAAPASSTSPASGPGRPELSAVGAWEIGAGEASVASTGIPPGADGNAGEDAGSPDGLAPIVASLGTESGPGPSSPGTALTPGTASGGALLPEPLPEAAPLPGDLFPSVPPLVPPAPPPGALLEEEGQQLVLPTLPEAPVAPEVPAVLDLLQEPVRDALPDPLGDAVSPARPDLLRDAVPTPDGLLGDGDLTKGIPGVGDGGKNDRPGIDALPTRGVPAIGGGGKGKQDRPGVDLPTRGVPPIGGGGVDLPTKGVPVIGGGGPNLPGLPR